jgi:hypothetical protein
MSEGLQYNSSGCKTRGFWVTYLGTWIFSDYLGVFATITRRAQWVIQPLVAIVVETTK